MTTPAKERYADPSEHYACVQAVLAGDDLTVFQKKRVLTSMAEKAKLSTPERNGEPDATGERPPPLDAMHAAQAELGEAQALPDQDTAEATQDERIRHVVVALSADPDGDRAVLDAARTVAELTPVQLHFVSVVVPLPGAAALGGLAPGAPAAIVSPHADQEHLDAAIEARRAALSDVAVSETHGNHDLQVRMGLIDDEILATAREVDASLIVVGSSERSWLEGLLSVDVARQVIGKAVCPVLVVPERTGA